MEHDATRTDEEASVGHDGGPGAAAAAGPTAGSDPAHRDRAGDEPTFHVEHDARSATGALAPGAAAGSVPADGGLSGGRSSFHVEHDGALPPAAAAVFGPALPAAERFAALLAGPGVERGLIGPREADRVWERHLLNSAVVAELVPLGARVLDVGSGAGLPGLAVALARPDLEVALLEPLARRVAWLEEVVAELGLAVAVHRGRAEDPAVRRRLGSWDVVTARAVAPLGRLAGWCLPLLADGGRLLAIKGASAAEEARRDAAAVRAAGGGEVEIRASGAGVVEPPATVVVVPRRRAARDPRPRRRKDR